MLNFEICPLSLIYCVCLTNFLSSYSYRNVPLDLSGSGGKRESLSPDNKRSSMAEAVGGSPLKAALLTGPGAPAQMKKGLQPGLGAGSGPAPGIAADLLPVK